MSTSESQSRVVYLFGAGASHACAQFVGSSYRTLMKDLTPEIAGDLHRLAEAEYRGDRSIEYLVNNVVTESVDIEQVITFLDQSPSGSHRRFADRLRQVFEGVLRRRLAQIEDEQGEIPDSLYYALLDMYSVPRLPEELVGLLTLNYDNYLTHAIGRFDGLGLDPVISLGSRDTEVDTVKVVNLHGSFYWEDSWPVSTVDSGTLWIPPGIQKAKDRYPFNLLWGSARELLECDILRIVGCSLGPNDWDLVSLLFATRHTNAAGKRYRVEVIDSPRQALRLQERLPYLDAKCVLEIPEMGPQLVSELIGGDPRQFDQLAEVERKNVVDIADGEHNWFLRWLRLKAEIAFRDLGSISTPSGAFENLMTAA